MSVDRRTTVRAAAHFGQAGDGVLAAGLVGMFSSVRFSSSVDIDSMQ